MLIPIRQRLALPGLRYHVHLTRRGQPSIPRKSRTFVTEAIQHASEGFLDLALAIPFPESIPPYSGTILAVTVAIRLATIPFSIWAKRRQWKTEEVVMPLLLQERPLIFQKIHEEMKKNGFRGNREQAQMEHAKRAQPMLKARQKELCKEHGCTILPTMLVPVLSQLPLFVAFSATLSKASTAPTVLDSEAFLTLTSLSHGDPTLALPIALGIITFANVDASRWFMTPEALARERQTAESNAKKRAAGEILYQPRKIFQNTLRLASVGRILIASLVPGSIQLYWVTSAAVGLVQTWALDWWDYRRRIARRRSAPVADAASSQPASSIATIKVRPPKPT